MKLVEKDFRSFLESRIRESEQRCLMLTAKQCLDILSAK